MKRLAWLTDIHLDFVESDDLDDLISEIKDACPDAVLIGGDIGTAATSETHLTFLEKHLRMPIYFVLGNHDYYGGSIADVRHLVVELARRSQRLHYLSESGIIELTQRTCMLGHDGWADGRCGNYGDSDVILNDYVHIADFKRMGREGLSGSDKAKRLAMMQALAEQAASHFEKLLREALEKYDEILILTHVPPFREACWHKGAISSDDYLPHFASKAVGDVLYRVMSDNPAKKLTVLCGHTHSEGAAEILPNLTVLTGAAEYGLPKIQRLIDID
jgi:predicted MPP superfamily phosphohydrolase